MVATVAASDVGTLPAVLVIIIGGVLLTAASILVGLVLALATAAPWFLVVFALGLVALLVVIIAGSVWKVIQPVAELILGIIVIAVVWLAGWLLYLARMAVLLIGIPYVLIMYVVPYLWGFVG